MADQPAAQAARMDHSQIEKVADLLSKLKAEARAANDAGDVFMLGVYKELVKVCSPIVMRAYARAEREENAAINQAHKGLRKAEREARAEQEAQAKARPEKPPAAH
jgi:hypothetical protein